MKISAITIGLYMVLGGMLQTSSFEKQALEVVEGMPASDLDAALPRRPFATWFNQLVGPQAGVVWQLTDCGERMGGSGGAGQDLPACAEVNACLPDGRVVIVMITVGTFKKGLSGKPAFFRAVVERDKQLYQSLRLSDVQGMLTAPIALSVRPPAKKMPINLPAIAAVQARLAAPFQFARLLPWPLNDNPEFYDLRREMMPPPPLPPEPQKSVSLPPEPQKSAPREPQKLSEGGLRANALTRAKPVYPQNAKMMNALGEVKVQITISEDGRVIEAKAVSGHLALRSAAVEAAFKWVFKPITFNGVPAKAEGILTFDFTPGDR